MPDLPAAAAARRPLISARKIVHMSMLSFAFLLPFLTWIQAAGAAVLALLFNVFVLPQIAVDLRKRAGDDTAAYTWTGIVLYPISVLALILFYRNSMHIAAAAWAIMALGDGTASVVGEGLRGPALPWNREKTWSGFCGFIVAGALGAFALSLWVSPALPTGRIVVICTAAAMVGAVVESVPVRLDDNVSVPLVTGAFMFCASFVERSALESNWPFLGRRILLAVAVNAAFALLALALKMITRSGAAVGFVLGVAIYLGYGYKSFSILLGFFLLGSIATRLGYAVKAARGVAERRRGARSWREALANSLAGAFFAILVITTEQEAAFLLAFVAAFAEAAGDTVSSEIGQWVSGRAYMITTLKPVPAGVDGGISFGGTVAGFAASALIVALGYAMGLCGPFGLVGAAIALGAGCAGNLFDSLLGATIERRGLVTNGIVNFSGTSFAGGLALVIALRLQM
jgi:uncharacterized protein (TIGR00297 family)